MFNQEAQTRGCLDTFFKKRPNIGISWIHDIGTANCIPAGSALLQGAEAAVNLEVKHVRVLSTRGSSFTIDLIDYAQYRKIIVFGRNASYEYPKRFGTRWYSVLWFALPSNKPCCDQHSTAALISSAFRKGSWKNYVPIHLPLVHDKLLKAKSTPSCIQKAENLSEKMHLPPSATLAYVCFASDVDYFP